MKTRSQTIKKSDLAVIRATFNALANAEGWDREFPKSLTACVMARLSDPDSRDVISHYDNKLREEFQFATEMSHEKNCAQRHGGECNCGAFEHNERVRGGE